MSLPNPPIAILRRLGVAALVLPLTVCAQVAPASGPNAGEQAEALTLSPFEVRSERDSGWVASSTLIGNRTNSELSEVPMTVDAITADFMKDLGAYTLEDAGLWVANLDVVSDTERKTDDQRLNYRGMQIGDRESGQSSRNFFLWYAPTDNYNVERIDFNKGSNSLMFGDASPGGQATVYTKRARFTNSAEVTALYGSDETHRVMLDVNRQLGDKVAMRVNLVDRREGSYLDYAYSALRAAHATFTVRPTQNTQFRFEAEGGEFERRRGVNQVRIRENSAPGRGFGSNNRWYYTSDGEIVRRTASVPAAIDRTGAAGDQLPLLEGQSADVRLRNGTTTFTGETVRFEGYDRSINLLGANDFLDRPYTNVTAWLEHRFGKLNLEFAYNQQNQNQNRNDAEFGTTISVDRNGRPYVDSELNRRQFGNRVKTGRFTASYELESGDWMKQFLVFTADRQRDFVYTFRENLANFANPTTNIANERIVVRAYLDDPQFPSQDYWNRFLPENLPQSANFRADWYSTTDANRPFADIRYSSSQSLSAKGTYFDGRFHSLLGVRFDHFKRKRIVDLPLDEIGQSIFLGMPDEAPDAYAYDPNFDLDNTSYTAGGVYRIKTGLNLYGTWSESFRWQGFQDFTGKVLGPIIGETKEVGLKSNLFGGLIDATFALYEVERANSRFVWSPNVLSVLEMEELFNPNDLAPGSPGYFTPATGLNDESRTVISTERSQGYEATLQLRRHRGFQARLTFAHNKIESTRDLSALRGLTDAAIARTQQALAPGGNPAMAEDQALINDALSILAANEGVETVTGSRGTPNSVSWILDYEFPRRTRLAGARLAVHGNWRDDYFIDNINGVNYTGAASHAIGCYATYRTKVLGRTTLFRLGVKNLANLERDGDYYESGVVRLDPAGVPLYDYRYNAPVTWDFSVNVEL